MTDTIDRLFCPVKDQFLLFLVGTMLFMVSTTSAAPPALRMMEDRIWLETEQTPITEVMAAFSHLGVDVMLDPSIQARISGTLEDVDVEEALKDLLGPFNYVLQWKQIEGPDGPLIVLSGMEVFHSGKRDLAKILDAGRQIVDPIDGPPYVKEELLLALNTKISASEFRNLLARIGGTVIDSLHPPGVYRVRLAANSDVPAMVELVKSEKVVHSAEPNYIYNEGAPNRLPAPDSNIRATTIPPPADGQPAVAVLDSGLMSLGALNEQIVAGYDATDPSAELGDPSGHGTQMALIASGVVNPHTGQVLNESVPVVAIKAFDENGHSSGYDILDGLAFAAKQGASVVNMSWGSEAKSDFLQNTLKKAKDQGLILVAAAGNEPTGRPVYPAAFPEVLSVGALGSDGDRWSQSNFGSFVDLVAPGSANLPVGHNGPPGSYGGTSISSAYTAKILAMYRQRNPSASADESISALRSSLTDLGAPGNDLYFGNGALDQQAVQRFLNSSKN